MPGNHLNGNSNLEIAQSSQDLIISKGKRNKRLWITGAILLLIVIALVVTIVVLVTTDNDEIEKEHSAITLEDFLEGKLNAKPFNATWMSDDELIYRDLSGSLSTFNVATKTKRELLPGFSETLQKSFDYELSPDRKYILLTYDYQKLYRHTYLARYTVHNLDTSEEVSLNVPNQFNGDVLQYATWGPEGNALVFVYNNNIYYKPNVNSEIVQLTIDGSKGNVYNGVPDWVYEEEIFSSNFAMWFSGDGKKLAYAKFNDGNTSLMSIPYYGTPGSLDSQYTKAVQIRYPKPGTTNPLVSLHVVNLFGNYDTKDLQIPNGLNDPVLASVTWATDEILCPVWMNRVQNESFILAYETSENNSPEIIKHLRHEDGWLDLFTPLEFSVDGTQIIIILSQDQGGNSGAYRHIVKLYRKSDSEILPITSGKFVVTEILYWDNSVVYYTANTEADPGVQHVYSLKTATNETTCLSCNETNSLNEPCKYNSAKFSDSAKHYVLNCAGPGVPVIAVHDSTNKKLLTWEDNAFTIDYVGSRSTPLTKRFTFDVPGGFKAHAMLKIPPGADLTGSVKYPMVVNVYGGPDTYQVVERYTMDWGSYLATNKSIIYAVIDGRGSGLKGDKMLLAGYRNLGTVEVEDQIGVAKQIQETLPYVDKGRTAIWGWSYGGYAASLALATDKGSVFKCGMAVAPVTDWTLYDSIYTERFMGLPANDNAEGYEKAKLINKYEGLREKMYFLIHGSFDDNVHYQQSMLWSKVLEHQDVLFRQQSYTDEDHGLAAVRPHLYHSLENFLDECFIENI